MSLRMGFAIMRKGEAMEWIVEAESLSDFVDHGRYTIHTKPLIRCRDCKFYTPMNRETKTGICNLTLHQNFGDDWFCAGAERRENG